VSWTRTQRTKTKKMRQNDAPVVKLTEWDTGTPARDSVLRDLSLPTDRRTRELMGQLADRGMLTLRELATGLEVETTSFVGSVALGPVTVRIQPKLGVRPLSCLLGYALGLHERSLDLFKEHDVRVAQPAFQDILAHHLCSEAARLIERGLYRQYTVNESDLLQPRGRVLFGRMVRQGGRAVTSLPCQYHKRDDNALPNRVVLSGLRFAARICVHNTIRIRALRLAGQLALTVNPVQLSVATFAAVQRASNRLTASYEPAVELIRLLVAGHGVTDTVGGRDVPLPGFMFDMNQLFQDLLERFLRDWLDDGDVRQQYSLSEVFQYQLGFNPLNRRTPTPRPDFVIIKRGQVAAILDAKYRDLWEKPLHREMLYQLGIYALSQAICRTATILYPTTTLGSRESRISIKDPVSGHPRAEVCLRPIDLNALADLVSAPRSIALDLARRQFARYMVHGSAYGAAQVLVPSVA
jgi:5-methylcytosine-specific restriction enzyme subunit McrC